MTVRANHFTPEVGERGTELVRLRMLTLIFKVLLSAPRRTAGVPNPDGTLALFSVSTYSFESHSKTSEIRVLDLKTGHTKTLCKDLNASDPTWLGKGNLLLWLKSGEKGTTTLVVADVDNLDDTYSASKDYKGPRADIVLDLKSLLRSMALFPILKSYRSTRTLSPSLSRA